MSFCEYCEVKSYSEPCICLKQNDICPLVRRCTKSPIWLPLNAMDSCALRKKIMSKEIDLKDNEYKVNHINKNHLYIEIGDSMIKLQNPYDYEPQKVELIKVDGEFHIKE